MKPLNLYPILLFGLLVYFGLLMTIKFQFGLLDLDIETMQTTAEIKKPVYQSIQNGILITPKTAEIIVCLIRCESMGNPNAWNKNDPNDGSKSILQFQDSTFDFYSIKAGIEKPDIWNIQHQIITANYMISNGLLNQWTCSGVCD